MRDETRGKPDETTHDNQIVELPKYRYEIGDKVHWRSQIDEGCPKKPF
jgi:hypothetical protein